MWNLLILALCFSPAIALPSRTCKIGFKFENNKCIDDNECLDDEDDTERCGEHAICINTNGSFICQCANGFRASTGSVNFSASTPAECLDINECEVENICGPNAKCFNAIPHYSCICDIGFIPSNGLEVFHLNENVTCEDINDCEEEHICGQNARCINTPGSYHCVCNSGFGLKSGKKQFFGNLEQCEDICMIDKTICGNGSCHRGASGHYCACHAGFTNYGSNESRCTDINECEVENICGPNAKCFNAIPHYSCICDIGFIPSNGLEVFHLNENVTCEALNCDVIKAMTIPNKKLSIQYDLVMDLKNICLESPNLTEPDGEALVKRLLSAIDEFLFNGAINDNSEISTFLDMVESILRFAGPFIKPPRMKASCTHAELELLLYKGVNIPQETVTLSSKHAKLDIQLKTAAGDRSYYPGFTTVSLLSHANMEDSAGNFCGGLKKEENQSYKMNSKVVTVTVSNRNTSHLTEPVNVTLYHLEQSNATNHICVFWDSSEEGGAWCARGCSVVESTPKYTVCSCNHLSSFAVLMALYEIENKFELQLITWVGLSLSLICLCICILTFSLIRSIQGPRTTIHLHLCISLFIATLVFLAGISRTENRTGCAVVAGLLHYFYLAAFCWMCLEGIQLFRMVVLVFNTHFKTLYMMSGGYGVPAVIVAISALANAKGYGTERYCWLNLELIWSFFGPACIIIIINIFFFLITVWKLAQKFSSLNPDLEKLQKLKAFIITAVAQLCVLGTMWIFGSFQFEEGTVLTSYLFTILGSLQGVLVFLMHCLFSKQVREEYVNILSRFCTPRKKSYSKFNYSHSSKAQASKSSQETGESHI